MRNNKAQFVRVERNFLDYLLLGNCFKLLNSSPAEQKPDFTAHNVGHGKPYPGELEYTQRLQNLGEQAYEKMKPILLGGGSIDEKERKLDIICNDYTQQANKEITTSLTTLYKGAVEYANTQLSKLKGVKPINAEEAVKADELSNLIGYQQHNFKKWIQYLENDLIDKLWIKTVFSNYKG